MNFINFNLQAERFLAHLEAQISEKKIPLQPHWSIDHICYRTASLEQYQNLLESVSIFARVISESEVNGRSIATFRLHQPLSFRNRTIALLEIPAPKFDNSYKEGFDHVEIVCDISFPLLEEILQPYSLDRSGLKKSINPELKVRLDGCSIKFHHMSLESLIHLEQNTLAYSSLQNLKILDKLHRYSPLIVGSFPLSISKDTSDFAILLKAEDLTSLIQELKKAYGNLPNFESHLSVQDGQQTLITRFLFQKVPYKLFSQALDPLKQSAFLHFQIEERILALGGDQIRRKINQLRTEGLKPEPAFSMALQLSGDPYGALIDLHKVTETDLQTRLKKALRG